MTPRLTFPRFLKCGTNLSLIHLSVPPNALASVMLPSTLALTLKESEPSTITITSFAGCSLGTSSQSQTPLTAIESSRALVATAMVEAMFMLNKNDEIKV